MLAPFAQRELVGSIMQPTTSAGKLARLADFRQYIYNRCLLRAGDTLFELLDAVLTSRSISSFAELSLSALFRRGWPSLYEALDDGIVNGAAISTMLIEQMLEQQSQSSPWLVLAIDHTSWPREQSYTLAERGFHYKAEAVPGNRPITIGYDFSTIAWIPHTPLDATAVDADEAGSVPHLPKRDSWCLPLVHERIERSSSPLKHGAEQLRALIASIAQRAKHLLLVGDSEYASAGFVEATADIPAEKLFRLRPNRVLYAAPPPYSGKGRQAKHGPKFKLKDASTWTDAIDEQVLEASTHRSIRVRRFSRLHFREAASVEFDLVLVERLSQSQQVGEAAATEKMWLIWVGNAPLSLEQMWRVYLRRFCIDHWYRFAKQRLHWTTPKFSTPERSQTWSTLLLLGQWQLYLAREVITDTRLPWQKPQSKPTPGRVAESFTSIVAVIGTPARAPKPRGKSPGWPAGRLRQPRQQHTVERKTTRVWPSTPKPPP